MFNPFESKEEYWKYIKENTGLTLAPKNLDAIFEKLTKIKNGEVVHE